MDFTYVGALFLSAFAGLMISVAFLVKGAKRPLRWMRFSLLVALVLDLLLLVNWQGVGTARPDLLALDALLFAGFGVAGTIIGFLPAFTVIGLMRLFGRWPPR
jgi:hypothetical protein